MNLPSLGWNPFFEKAFEDHAADGCIPARVAVQMKGQYVVYSIHGELRGEVTGKLLYAARGPEDLPAVGDWVAIRPRLSEGTATITAVLPRKSKFSRKAPGKRVEEQIVASNVDIVYLVSSFDAAYNLRRLERYLVVASSSGASPVVLLNKADLAMNREDKKKEVAAIAGDVPVHLLSAKRGEGLETVMLYLGPGVTGALLGSSGVGKSTIINALLGREHFRTQEVRKSDDRGRHTTSQRELVIVPSGGMLIDTPGMRELQILGVQEGVDESFEDIEELALKCRFRNCQHVSEPGCAVRSALEDGTLDSARFQSHQKLLRELDYQERASSTRQQQLFKDRAKKLTARHKRGYRR
jgi:ribosome biogenesis GTPase